MHTRNALDSLSKNNVDYIVTDRLIISGVILLTDSINISYVELSVISILINSQFFQG